MPRSRPRALLSVVSILTLLVMLTTSLPWVAPPVQAQIDNNLPNQAYASVVDCIRPAADLGSPRSADSPRYATTCMSSAWDITNYEGAGNPSNGDAPFTEAGVTEFGDGTPDVAGSEPGHVTRATIGSNGKGNGGIGVGAVYGLAYASGTNPASPYVNSSRIYTSAFAKRMTRFGSGGPGAIYMLNRTFNTETLYVQIPQVVPGPSGAVGSPGDGASVAFPNGQTAATYDPYLGGIHTVQHDYVSLSMIGKTGLGDLDLDPQERYLYGVNLLYRSVFRIDTWSATPQSTITYLSQHAIFSSPASCNVSGAGGPQDLRPFGLHVTSDSLYLGFTCSAQSSQDRRDLGAGVVRYDLASGTWDSGLAVGLVLPNYDAQRTTGGWNTTWRPWQDNAAYGYSPAIEPQPLIADIAFDENGTMMIGMRDRLGDLASTPRLPAEYGQAQGDLLLAPRIGPFTWAAPSTTTEHFRDDAIGPAHAEQAWGAVTYVPGTHSGAYGGEVATTLMTPYRIHSGGVAWFDASGGGPTAREELYNGYNSSFNPSIFAKAQGLGDIEVLCDWRAIGDRVWNDTNGNGTQDSGESDINGVLLNLRDSNGNVAAQVTTGSVSGMSGNYRFYVNPFASYTVEIDPSNYAAGRPLFGLAPTVANVGSDVSDSDADVNGRIAVSAAGNRDVNVSFDAGVASGANVRITKTGPATAALGSSYSYTLSYANDGPSSAGNVVITDVLPGGISFVSATPPATSGGGQMAIWNVGTLASGASGTITINVNVLTSAPASVVNTATISTSTSGDNPNDNSSSWTTTITRPNVTVVKTGPATAAVGSTISYTLATANTGSALATNVQVIDTLPVGLTYLAAIPAPTTVSGQTLTWNAGTLNPSATGSYTVQAQVTNAAATSVVNTATIATSSSGDDPSDNSSSWTTTILRPNVTITKTGPATVTAGDPLAYTLSYRNTGSAPAASVQIVDTLPAGVTFISASPAPTSVAGQVLTWNMGTIAAGGSGSITLNVQTSATLVNGTSLTNNVQISTTSLGDDPNDNTSTTTTAVQRADVYVTKSSPTTFPVVSGQSVTYLIDYGNNGPATARSVTLTDPMPSQITGATWSCVSGCSGSGSGNISIALGDVAAGATGRISVTGTATTTVAREDFTNTATIMTTTPETSTSNNTSSVPGAVWTTDIQLIKLASPQVIAGTTFTATLQYRNNGPAGANAVSLTDTLPAGVTFVASNPAPSSQSGQTLTWTLGTLADAQSGSISLVLQSDPTLADASVLTNRAVIATTTTDRDSSNNTASADTRVLARADVRITKTGPTTVNVGDPVTFTLTYANSGPSLARSVVISDTLPSDLDYTSASPAPSSNANGILAWNVGDLAPGASGTITLVMQTHLTQAVNSLPVTNRASITTTTTDPDPSNNSSTHTVNILRPNVTVAKAGPSVATNNQNILYTLIYQNTGAASAANVQVVDTLPPGLTFISASPSPTSVSGQQLTWNVGTLVASGSGIITVIAQVQPTSPTTLINTADITTPSPGDDPTDNRSTTTTIVQRADVGITKSGPTTAIVGNPLTYTLGYQVVGTTIAANTIITDTLPSGITFVSSTPSPSSVSGQQLVWNLGSVSPGTSGSITLQTTVTPSAASTVTNTVRISTPTDGDDPANNTASVTTTIQRPNVTIVKTGPATVNAGDDFTYTLTYTNTGTAPALNVVLTDTLPAGITFVSSTPAPSTITGATLQWNLGTLAPGANGTITLQVLAATDPPVGGGSVASVTNTGTIATPSPGDNPGDNTSTTTTTIRWPDLSIVKTDGLTQVQPGDVVTYTLTIRNRGLIAATGVTLTETPPAGVSVLSTNWARQTDGSFTHTIGRINPGTTITRTFVMQLPNPLPGTSITNTVHVAGDLPDPTPSDTTSTDTDPLISGQVGDLVWNDANGNGQQESNEAGLAGVTLQLINPTTLAPIATRTSDAHGAYLFDGLRMGRYVVQIDPQTTLSGAYAGYRLTTAALFDRTLTTTARSDLTADVGLRLTPTTDVTLASFHTQPSDHGLIISWTTIREINTERFIIVRSATPDQQAAIEIASIASQGTTGGSYTITDQDAPESGAYYWLIEVERGGKHTLLVAWPQRMRTESPFTVFLPAVRK